MYGQHVTVDGLTVFVLGIPEYTQEEWQKRALQQISKMKPAEIYAAGYRKGQEDAMDAAAKACKAVERIHAAANDVMYSAVAGQCRTAIRSLPIEQEPKE